MPTIYRLIHAGIISFFLSLFLSCSIAHSIEDYDQKAFFACPSSQSDTDMTEKPDQSDSFRKSSADFIHELSEKHHFNKNELVCLFDQIEPNPTTIRLVTPASTQKPKNWQAYRQRMIEPTRISAGLRFWNQYETYLDWAEKKFGVPPHMPHWLSIILRRPISLSGKRFFVGNWKIFFCCPEKTVRIQ